MKPGIYVHRKNLLEALEAMRPLVASKGAIEALKCVHLLFEADQQRPDGLRLLVRCTDLHHSLVCEVEALEGLDSLSVLIDLGRLVSFVKGDWGEQVRLAIEDGSLVVEGAARASFVPSCRVEDYPTLPVAPADGWIEMSYAMTRELAMVAGFCKGEDPKKGFAALLEKRVFLYEAGGSLGIFGGQGHAAVYRMLPISVPAGFQVQIGKDCAGILSLLGPPCSIRWGEDAVEGPRHNFFRGSGWSLSEIRSEDPQVDPGKTLARCGVEASQEVLAVEQIVRALEIMPGDLHKPVTMDSSRGDLRIQAMTDAESREVVIEGRLPYYQTLFPDLMAKALRELSRISLSSEKPITVGSFSEGKHLRFEVEGEVIFLLTGAV